MSTLAWCPSAKEHDAVLRHVMAHRIHICLRRFKNRFPDRIDLDRNSKPGHQGIQRRRRPLAMPDIVREQDADVSVAVGQGVTAGPRSKQDDGFGVRGLDEVRDSLMDGIGDQHEKESSMLTGRTIRDLRECSGQSIEAVARACRMPPALLRSIEAGRLGTDDRDLERIARHFGMTVENLTGG